MSGIDLYTATIIISVALFVAVGSYSGRKVKELDDYFVAGRRAPTFLIVGTLVASVFSTSIFLGEAGFTYDGQMGAYILLPGIAVAGYVYGALHLDHFYSLRPIPGHAGYRMPVDGVYLCGSGAHPGGGVSGLPGHNAARAILKDR